MFDKIISSLILRSVSGCRCVMGRIVWFGECWSGGWFEFVGGVFFFWKFLMGWSGGWGRVYGVGVGLGVVWGVWWFIMDGGSIIVVSNV